MKKKMLSLALAAAMLVGAAVPAMAVRSSAGADGHVMEQYPTQPLWEALPEGKRPSRITKKSRS